LINFSGKKTGRSPTDKCIVFEETSNDDIWWGPVNIKMDERKLFNLEFAVENLLGIDDRSDTFEINRNREIDYLNTRKLLYIFDGYVGVSCVVTYTC
jgi:phosphoenolpyruvate carboxykinase (ATP)